MHTSLRLTMIDATTRARSGQATPTISRRQREGERGPFIFIGGGADGSESHRPKRTSSGSSGHLAKSAWLISCARSSKYLCWAHIRHEPKLSIPRACVVLWRNCHTLHLRTNAAQHPLGDERHRFGHRTSPCASEPGAHLVEPQRRGSDGLWGERARWGSLTDRLRRATVR
jgi:hypothetical protein